MLEYNGIGESATVLLEIHYYNPTKYSITDTSGFMIYYTTNLRKYNMGIMLAGVPLDTIPIPTGNPTYKISKTCSSNCTNNIKQNGVKLIFAILHGHKLLDSIGTDINFADGSVDNTTIRDDLYKIGFQHFLFFKNPIWFNAGDSLTTYCLYHSTNSNTTILEGKNNDAEVCYSFIAYYPKENGIDSCIEQNCIPDPAVAGVLLNGYFLYKTIIYTAVCLLFLFVMQ